MSNHDSPQNDPGPAPGDVIQMISDAVKDGPDAFLAGFRETGDGPRQFSPEQLAQLESLEERLMRDMRRAGR